MATRASSKAYQLGIVEGFFGRSWSWRDRLAYAGFLREQGFDAYLYAPKGDLYFRKQWFRPSPPAHLAALQKLSEHYREAGLDFGIGLSPFELYRDFSPARRALLAAKIEEINRIAPGTLCILFDDMHGSLPALASLQAEIMDFVQARSQAGRFLLCPTYYSQDPILAREFGEGPEHYLEDLGALLDPAVAVCWTGPRVISRDYPAAHLREVGALLGRKPLIWDNYPVNDARRLCPFLHLRPFEREPAVLTAHCSGHFANPMNQAWLSRLPLYGLAALYRGESATLEQACLALCGPEVGRLLVADSEAFQDGGLESLDPVRRRALRARYAAFPDSPFARELVDWLDGVYTFDPACLT